MFLEFERQKNILCTTTSGWKALLNKNISQALSEKNYLTQGRITCFRISYRALSIYLSWHIYWGIVLQNREGVRVPLLSADFCHSICKCSLVLFPTWIPWTSNQEVVVLCYVCIVFGSCKGLVRGGELTVTAL